MKLFEATATSTLLAILAASSSSFLLRTVSAQDTTTLRSATSVPANGQTYLVTAMPTGFSAEFNPASSAYITVAGWGATASVSGDLNQVQAYDGGYAQVEGNANYLSVSEGTASISGTGGQFDFGDGAQVMAATLTDAVVSAQLTQGGFTGQLDLTSGYMIQTAVGFNSLTPTAPATVTVTGQQVRAFQNQFVAEWKGSGNKILVFPSDFFRQTDTLPPQPTISLGGSDNSMIVTGLSTDPNTPFALPTGYAVGVTIGDGPNNIATLNNRVDATVTGTGNSALVTGTYQPTVYVASGAAVEVRAFGLTGSAADGGLLVATDYPLQDGTQKMKRELVAPTDVNTISVERGGVAVVSGVSIAATAGPLGTVIDLGDAYVSVQSGGFAEISSMGDPDARTATVDAGATASLGFFAQAVVQDGAAPIQTPPGSVVRATRISPDQRLFEVLPNPSLVARARRARRASFDEDRPLCSNNLTHCPISSSAFECIDTLSNLESCGGCWYSGEGKDCSTIEGVDAVGCVDGACVVESCADGYRLAADGEKCVLEV